jgi:geranylgeranyl diphosphate synthase type I
VRKSAESVAPRPAEAFRDHLAAVRTSVEARLEALWKPKRKRAASLGDEVVAMVEVADDLTMRGGKRYRAGMLVAAFLGVTGAAKGSAARGAIPAAALEGGAALELLQSYLLIQDDWMDGDVERRGGPSAHVALAERLGGEARGAASAMLASDLVWNMAVEVLAGADVPPARRTEAILVFCRMHEDVVLGQQLDTMNAACNVEIIHDLKTGSYTARGPLALGAALAGASTEAQRALEKFAAPVGVAFQLRDDLIGTFADAELAGRPRASDIRSGKRSAVIRAAEPLLDASGKRALAAAFGKPAASEEAIDGAVKALEASGVRDAVHGRLEKLCAKAEKLAAALPLTERSRTLLAGGAAALRLDPSHLGAVTRTTPRPSSGRSRRA